MTDRNAAIPTPELFQIIQGGMGVGVSGWPLARTVSRMGQLGVVSGTGLAVLLVRKLQVGDPDGHMRRAMDHFPFPEIAQRVLDRYYIPGGKADDEPFKLSPAPQVDLGGPLTELTVVSNFVEVYLAKEGHAGVVGINYLEKMQFPTLASLFGAMLAGVDYVLMGAGIPRFIPGILDALSEGRTAELKIDVEDCAEGAAFVARFDPVEFCNGKIPPVRRPKFLAIISSATLAMTLARKSNGKVDGFVVEGATAGGHNAPPRGPMQLNDIGEPIYGPRDTPDLDKIKEIGLPFWLAGGYAEASGLERALATGAAGVQIGTAFAFCNESSINTELKQQIIAQSVAGEARIFTDPVASPTGFPFKVVRVEGTLSEPETYENRPRICDLGYLRRAYQKSDGTLGYRCPAEPVDQYVKKGGTVADTVGRKCLCNGLFGTIGLGQLKAEGPNEQAIVTAGDEVLNLGRFLKPGATSYSAAEVVELLLGRIPQVVLV